MSQSREKFLADDVSFEYICWIDPWRISCLTEEKKVNEILYNRTGPNIISKCF